MNNPCEECCENSDKVTRQNTALRELCGEMVEKLKRQLHDPVEETGGCWCTDCLEIEDLIHRHEQLMKGKK